MTTLNGGFAATREQQISNEDRDLIREFIAKKGIKKLPPSNLPGSETDRATNELIALRRREFRSNRRQEAKERAEAAAKAAT